MDTISLLITDIKSQHPRYQLGSPIALQIPFIDPFSNSTRTRSYGLVGTSRAITSEIKVSWCFCVLACFTRTTQSRLSGVSTSPDPPSPPQGQSSPHFPDFPKLFSNATIFVIRRPSNGRLQAFPIATKTPTLAVTLKPCMKLIDVFRLHNLLCRNRASALSALTCTCPLRPKCQKCLQDAS
jgi:hypothetical protein